MTPILVNDNVVDVLLTPAAKVGDPATCEFRPRTDYVQIDVQVETIAEGKPAQIEVERVGPQRFAVRGQMPAGSKPLVRICSVEDPPGYARALFIEALRRTACRFGPASTRRRPRNCPIRTRTRI